VPRFARLIALVVLAWLTSGCGGGLHYITQAAAGQEKLNGRGIEIKEIVEGQHLDKRTRGLLAQVATIKAFGEKKGLKHTNNYERYIWLGRPAVVWVVSACNPLAFRPKTWKFPIVGSITYTGWFDQKEAREYAEELKKKGWDVDVRPSQAYSTLGWFDDPILSTMIADGDEALGDLADVVLHETLHATFYVPGQSTPNEWHTASRLASGSARMASKSLKARASQEGSSLTPWEKGVTPSFRCGSMCPGPPVPR